jgi:hypothetical protein
LAVRRWAKHWGGRNIQTILIFYCGAFKPAGSSGHLPNPGDQINRRFWSEIQDIDRVTAATKTPDIMDKTRK